MGIFKAYDIRGIYKEDLDEAMARKIGNAFARYLKAETVVVGRDMRESAVPVSKALMEGICKAGTNVINIGLSSTPMTYFSIGCLQADGGISVTASHNPPEYIGFKVSREDAIPLGGETGLKEIEKMVMEGQEATAGKEGRVQERDIKEEYCRHVLSYSNEVRPLKVVVDAANAMGSQDVTIIQKSLPCRFVPLFFELDGTFPNHEANPLKAKNLLQLQKAVKKEGAHLGVAFDGDADRCAFVDERGERIGCDLITALIAKEILRENPGAGILYDLRSSRVVPEEIQRHGGRPIRERVGHAFMRATMRREKGIFGGELSGHYYYASNYFSDSGIITLVLLLGLLSREGGSLSHLVSPLKRYYATGEVNFVVEDKDRKIEEIARRFSDAAIDYLDGITVVYKDFWLNVRKSNTEPLLRLNLEAVSEEKLEEAKEKILPLLGTPLLGE